jgi:hypothetical protein
MKMAGSDTLAVLGLLSVGVLGCTGPQAGERGYTKEHLGDTIHVHNLTPLYTEPAELEPELRVGMMDGPDEYIFVDIYSLAVGPQGEIYAGGVEADGGIREFNRNGTFQRWVARAGPGPMEVRYITALSVNPEGVLAAREANARQVKLFFPDGGFEMFSAMQGLNRFHEDALQFHNDGSLWIGLGPPLSLWEPIPYPRPIFARISAARELVDTIFAPERLGEQCLLGSIRYGSGVWRDKRDPWFPLGKWALGPDGTLALGCPADYTFDLIREGQRTGVSELSVWRDSCASTRRDTAKVRTEGRRQPPRSRKPAQLCELRIQGRFLQRMRTATRQPHQVRRKRNATGPRVLLRGARLFGQHEEKPLRKRCGRGTHPTHPDRVTSSHVGMRLDRTPSDARSLAWIGPTRTPRRWSPNRDPIALIGVDYEGVNAGEGFGAMDLLGGEKQCVRAPRMPHPIYLFLNFVD